ncbi:MAG TPA: hypothetical protein PLJ21_11045 [Pseudobdellovibrionaceae bacterium]|nr:hypothetical protein [Pseudobdellovibrionaceae bacterium]
MRLILCILFITQNCWGKTHAFFLGGGGEQPTKKTTTFDDTLENFYEAAKKKKWPTTVVFNGGLIETEKKFPDHQPFTKLNFEQTISALEEQIKSNKIKEKEQILLSLASHGLESSPISEVHNISTTDGRVPISRLKALVSLAESKNIKLAILDLSCFGGKSIALSSEKTCVISSTTPNNFGIKYDADNLFKNIKNSNNLEEAFLVNRAQSETPGFPQISTKVGKNIHNHMRPFQSSLRIGSQLSLNNTFWGSCAGPKSDYDNVFKLMKALNIAEPGYLNISFFEKSTQKLIKEFKEKIAIYEAYKKDLLQKLKLGDQKICIENIAFDDCKILPENYYDFHEKGKESPRKTCLEIKSIDYQLKANEEGLASLKLQYPPGQPVRQIINCNKRIEKIRALKASDNYLDFSRSIQSVQENGMALYDEVTKISKLERVIYDQAYKKLATKENGANPCRDFVL